jgi:magnesium transporter
MIGHGRSVRRPGVEVRGVLSALSPQGPVDVAAGTPEAIQVLRGAIWVDALDPSADEARAVEEALGIQLPTRVEAAEIEVSSRLYVEAGTAFMTATVMIATDSPYPETGPVTFAFRPDCLVTLRFADPRPFVTFRRRMARTPTAHATAQKLFVALVDEIVDRVADILEAVGGELNTVSRSVFAAGDQGRLDYTTILARIGHTGELAANARESLVTLGRAIGFAV